MTYVAKFSTARANGMSFIANRWVFTGDSGYAVQESGTVPGTYNVVSYPGDRVCGLIGLNLSRADALAMAQRLATPRTAA